VLVSLRGKNRDQAFLAAGYRCLSYKPLDRGKVLIDLSHLIAQKKDRGLLLAVVFFADLLHYLGADSKADALADLFVETAYA